MGGSSLQRDQARFERHSEARPGLVMVHPRLPWDFMAAGGGGLQSARNLRIPNFLLRACYDGAAARVCCTSA